MLETSTRLLDLLSLLQTRREWSGRELAERLEVGPRTIRRDVDRLRRLGYPVEARRGVAGGYRLAAGASLPPLLLDADEAVAVAVGLRAAASAGVEGIEETSALALAKLEQLLPAQVRRRVNALGAATVAFPGSGPAADPETLAAIAAACRDLERLRFTYCSHDGTTSRRLVEPFRLVHTGRRWYLVAWDLAREDWRTFRVDRIERRPSADRRFEPRDPPADDLVAYVTEGFASVRDRYQAEILLHAPLREVSGRIPRWAGTLEEVDERTCVLRAGSDWPGGLAIYVADLDVEFEVREPPELRELLGELAKRFARAAAPTERPGR